MLSFVHFFLEIPLMQTNSKLVLTSVILAVSSGLAMAAPDVTAITAVVTDVATVAAAVFGVFVAIKAAKFIRRAL